MTYSRSRPASGILARFDEWNQRKLERANRLAAESAHDRHYITTAAGESLAVEILPTGCPVNDWGELGLLLLPISWVRHRVFHRDDYSVIIYRPPGRLGGLNRVYSRHPGLTLGEARSAAARFAEDLQ